ncbi:MAG: RNA polymerase sigma factor [Polyangiaceae bacterium]
MGRVLFLPRARDAEPLAVERPSGILTSAVPKNDDAELVARLRAGDPDAGDLLVDLCRAHVERVLFRVLGRTADVDDLVHDVFIAVLESVQSLREDAKFRGWLTQVTVFVARGHIRKRRRKWWLVFPGDLPERSSEWDCEASEALRATYRVLGKLDADERIAFALRKIEGMELTEVASACGVSLATIKRWIMKAEARFMELAAEESALAEWISEVRS